MVFHLSPLVIFILWCLFCKTGQQVAGGIVAFFCFIGVVLVPLGILAAIFWGLVQFFH